MPFLQCLLPDSNLLRLENYQIDTNNHRLTLDVSSTVLSAQCPLCSTATRRIHSYYKRTLADLQCAGFQLTLVIQVGKFFCDNWACLRRIFTERLGQVAAPWARKTVRLVEHLQAIALALGGAAGSRLSHQVGYQVSGSTLLNHLKKLSLPKFEVPAILGVDDFAWRRGRQYGTILVDLEQHQPIALLADRKAETLAGWLTQHPGVKVLSRDRSSTYKSGMNQGAPEALQVTDRFHLVQNLGEILEQVFSHYQRELKMIEQKQRQTVTQAEETLVTPEPTASTKARAKTRANHQRRVEQQQQIKKLDGQQWSQEAIAQTVGVSVSTVRRFLHRSDLPATPPRRRSFGRSLLDPYKPAVIEWFNSGMRQSDRLMSLLKQKGYTGGRRTLQRYLSSLRQSQGIPPKRGQSAKVSGKVLPKVKDPQSPPLTPRRAAYLLLKKPEKRNSEETELLEQLVTIHPTLANAVELANQFLQMLRQRQPEAFDDWLMAALKSPLQPFQFFAESLSQDYAAVKASLTLDISNGPVEGLNNRLKMLKRQMYGRAGLELLSKRLILAQ